MKFTKAFAKFVAFAAILMGLLLVFLEVVILLFPQMILHIWGYAVGGALLIIGLLFIGCTVRELLKS